MIMRFLTRAAAKASLTNIKFDLDNLKLSFPHDPEKSAKLFFKLVENITMALENNATEAEIKEAIHSKADSLGAVLAYLAEITFHLCVASRLKDYALVNSCDERINQIFKEHTGHTIEQYAKK